MDRSTIINIASRIEAHIAERDVERASGIQDELNFNFVKYVASTFPDNRIGKLADIVLTSRSLFCCTLEELAEHWGMEDVLEEG